MNSWQQMTDEQQQAHEDEISREDWADYTKWLDRDRPWWMYLKEEESWLKRQN